MKCEKDEKHQWTLSTMVGCGLQVNAERNMI